MGLFTRKKRDPPRSTATTPTSQPSHSPSPHSLAIPLDQRSTASDQSQKSRSPKARSPSRFHNIFRSTSHSDPVPTHSIATLPPLPRQSLSDQSNSYSRGRDAQSQTSTPFRNHPTSDGSWDDAGTPLRGRPSLNLDASSHLEPLDRYRQFAGRGGNAASTVSLPASYGEDPDARRRISTSTARETINETIYPVTSVGHGDERSEAGGGKWSRWKMGRAGGSKQRTGSMSSMRVFGGGDFSGGNGHDDEDEGGFVVKSFRTVSRVHEDPVASASPTSPPLPSLPSGSAISVYDQQESQQQESIRASIDLGSSQTRRPPLSVLPNNSNSNSSSSGRYNFGDRAPSPSTISVEAFRLASARTKSSVSLVSLNVDSPPLDNDRPKFEPVQRPSSRASRRQSTYSELSVDTGSAFLPPRPRFAHHSNSSNSSIQSRKSSNHSIGGTQTPPVAQTPPSDANDLNPSESLMSINSFTTAAEPRTAPTSARSTPAVSRVSSPSAKSPSTSPYALPTSSSKTGSAIPVRPAAVKRLSSGDSELRWIASYADSITSSEITTSPVAFQNPPLPFPPAHGSKTSPVSTPKSKSGPSRISHTPSFSVQPPTPATVSDASPSSSPSASRSPPSNRQYPQRTSSLVNDSTKAALRSMGVGDSPRRQSTSNVSKPSPTSIKSNKKAARAASRGWMSDSSDEDEQEALETDNSNSDSDDEVPLSQIRSRSQTDLSLPPALVQAEQRAKAELEATATPSKPAVQAAESKLTGGAGGGGSTLGLARRGSNRRSVSTLSLATSVMAIPTMTAASSSTPNFAPSSPTRSILQRPHHPRSVSNPNTPFPTSASVSAPPPVPALPAGVADRSSSSSGTGSSSSALLTPGDLSPAVSDLGLKSHPGLPNLSKPSVKFDLAALSSQSDAGRWNKGRRASAIHTSQSTVGSQFSLHRPTQSLQPSSFAPQNFPRAAASLAPSRGPRSSLAPSPSSNSMASSRTAVEGASTPGSVYDRMKARHKQEAVEALKIGADLNHPSGLVPEHVGDDDDEDEDEPLANLPTRGGTGSMIGGMDAGGSMLGGVHSPYGAMGMNVGVGFGGAYSPLAVAPFGVDPYLYASLPLDQKMSLHQRSQQMMAMMQQAAIQASVVAGSAVGGATSREGSMLGGECGPRRGGGGGGAGPRGRLHGASMSMSNLESFAAGQTQFNVGARLPPFAPTFAMSNAFMQPGIPAYHHHQQSGSVYQVPTYANSALGFSPALGGGGGSTLGGPTNRKGLNPGGRAASMMGFDQRK
ncbi:hypothetical protein JCM11491_004535 [Sporobolomyces phaffii]